MSSRQEHVSFQYVRNGNFHCQDRDHENKLETHSNLHIYQTLTYLQCQIPLIAPKPETTHSFSELQRHFLSITLQGHLPSHKVI